MVKHHQFAPFLNRGTTDAPDWVRIKKSTALSIALNPVTEEYEYAADEMPTTEIKNYKPTLNQPLAMYEHEPDYKLIFDFAYNMKTGNEAKMQTLLVFYHEKNPDGSFKAWLTESVISCNNIDFFGSTIDFDILFGGEVKKGSVMIAGDQPVFTQRADEFIPFTFTVRKGTAAVGAATVTVAGTAKTTDAAGKAVFVLKSGVKHLFGAEKGTDSTYGTTGVVSTTNKDLTVTFP